MRYRYEILANQPGSVQHNGWGGFFEEVYVKEYKEGVKEVDGGLILAIFFGPGARLNANQLVRDKVLKQQLEDAPEDYQERRMKQQPMWYMGHELIEERRGC